MSRRSASRSRRSSACCCSSACDGTLLLRSVSSRAIADRRGRVEHRPQFRRAPQQSACSRFRFDVDRRAPELRRFAVLQLKRKEGEMKTQRVLTRLAVAVAGMFLVVGLATAASGDPDGGVAVADGARDAQQHGTTAGHLHPEGSSSNVALISKLKLKNVVPEKIADVGVFKGYAYLAAWGVVTCKYNGVHVVDVRNPAAPKEAAFIQAKEGSYPGEGIQALNIDTTAYNGDILVSNNGKCKDTAGFGGMNIYDISKPASPTPLVEGIGDYTVTGQGKKDAHEIHSVFAWDAGSKAYAVIVDNEEGTDVDIIDITDPKKASLIAEYDLDQRFPQILQASPSNLTEVFFHDVVVKEIGGRQGMLLS